jgi:hypothetical protein
MDVPTSEVGYTSATAGRGGHGIHNGHVVALEKKNLNTKCNTISFKVDTSALIKTVVGSKSCVF